MLGNKGPRTRKWDFGFRLNLLKFDREVVLEVWIKSVAGPMVEKWTGLNFERGTIIRNGFGQINPL